jgi:hypothetical protein
LIYLANIGCGDWICSRTYEVGADKSRLKLVVALATVLIRNSDF